MSRPRAKLTGNFPGCPVESALSFLDGKWKGVILYHLTFFICRLYLLALLAQGDTDD